MGEGRRIKDDHLKETFETNCIHDETRDGIIFNMVKGLSDFHDRTTQNVRRSTDPHPHRDLAWWWHQGYIIRGNKLFLFQQFELQFGSSSSRDLMSCVMQFCVYDFNWMSQMKLEPLPERWWRWHLSLSLAFPWWWWNKKINCCFDNWWATRLASLKCFVSWGRSHQLPKSVRSCHIRGFSSLSTFSLIFLLFETTKHHDDEGRVDGEWMMSRGDDYLDRDTITRRKLLHVLQAC